MTRHDLALLLCTGLLSVGCATSSSSSTGSENPDEAAGDDAGEGEQPKTRPARDSIGAKHVASRKGVKKISAKKPPRDPKDLGPALRPADPGTKVGISSFVPTAASPGSAIEIFGSGFTDKAKVTVGGKAWTVSEATDGRVVATVPKGAKDGNIKVKVGKKSATSKGKFSVMEDDGGFGKPSVDPNHGLLGNVYVIGKEVSELPSFNDIGSPVAVIAVDTLDVPKRDFKQGFPGVEADLVEWFAIHFKGSLNIAAGQEGEYELCLNSDDGSQLYLDETPVVDNDGVHPVREKCEVVYMEAGEYQVDILYFQGPRYEIALQWSWAKDGGAKQIVPKDALFRPRDRAGS